MKRNKHDSGRGFLPSALGALAVGLLAFLLYFPSLSSGFVYDAEAQILNDSYIHTPANLWDVVSLRILGHDMLDFNRPFYLFSMMMDSLCWGKNPFGYHLTSNLLHAINSALVFLLAVLLLEPARQQMSDATLRTIAFLGALFFAVHPASVEPVAEVSYREDSLAVFFILLALLGAERFARTGASAWWGVGSIGAVFLACASKETGMAAPFALMLYWVLYQRGKEGKRWGTLIGGAFLAATVFFVLRFSLQPRVSQFFLHPPTYIGGSLGAVFLIQPRLWLFLLKLTFFPVPLSADYVPQNLAGFTLPIALAGLAVFLAVQGLLAWKSRVAAFGAGLFWLGLAPVSNFFPLYRPLADRFLYLPLVGMALMLAGLLCWASSRRLLFRLLVTLSAFAIVALVVLNWQRQPVFSTPYALWSDTVAKSPFSTTASSNMGFALVDKKEWEKALKWFQRTQQLANGKNAGAWAGAAIAFENLGRPDQAEESLRAAVSADATYDEPQRLVGLLLLTQSQADVLKDIKKRMPSTDGVPPAASAPQ